MNMSITRKNALRAGGALLTLPLLEVLKMPTQGHPRKKLNQNLNAWSL